MRLERLDTEYRTHRDVDYKVTVYYSPASSATGEERHIVVEPNNKRPLLVGTTGTDYSAIETVRSSVPLNPTSIWPWKDPDPVPKDEHVASACGRFEDNIDNYLEHRDKATA